MLAAINELAEKDGYDLMKEIHKQTAEYLQACNLVFENVILSHEMITTPYSTALINMEKGMKWFLEWKEEAQKDPGNCNEV